MAEQSHAAAFNLQDSPIATDAQFENYKIESAGHPWQQLDRATRP